MDFRAGDIAACFGTDATSRMIQFCTYWPLASAGLRIPPSHVAILSPDERGKIRWWESTTLSDRPCLSNKKPVNGVQVHQIEDRITDYLTSGGKVVIYRLVQIDELDPTEVARLYRMLQRFVNRRTSYDAAGAAISGLRVMQLLRLLPAANNDRLFCSELISAVLQRLCRMNRDNPTRFNPGRLIRTLVYEGTYRRERTYDDLEQLARTNIIPFPKAA